MEQYDLFSLNEIMEEKDNYFSYDELMSECFEEEDICSSVYCFSINNPVSIRKAGFQSDLILFQIIDNYHYNF